MIPPREGGAKATMVVVKIAFQCMNPQAIERQHRLAPSSQVPANPGECFAAIWVEDKDDPATCSCQRFLVLRQVQQEAEPQLHWSWEVHEFSLPLHELPLLPSSSSPSPPVLCWPPVHI